MSRSNVTKHGMIHRMEIDYSTWPKSRTRNILTHYKDLYARAVKHPQHETLIESYDERVGAPFAWPETRFSQPENLN